MKSLPFAVEIAALPVVRVTSSDGRTWEMRVGLSVYEVVETGETNPDGTPGFDLRMNITTDTRRTMAVNIEGAPRPQPPKDQN